MGSDPDAVSSDGTHVWVANEGANTVTEINASTGSVVQTIPRGRRSRSPSPRTAPTSGWRTRTATRSPSSTPRPGAVVQTIAVGSGPDAISSDGTHVWVANQGDNTVTELNASTGAVVQTISVGNAPLAISSDGTHVWVANYADGTITELIASTGAVVQTIAGVSEPDAISSDGTHVWVANEGADTVTELNASTGSVVQTIAVGSLPAGVSSDGTHVWVANEDANTVTELVGNETYSSARLGLPLPHGRGGRRATGHPGVVEFPELHSCVYVRNLKFQWPRRIPTNARAARFTGPDCSA